MANRIKYWVLKEGKNYYRMWTPIGPCATQRIEEAERFRTRADAMRSPAYRFVLTCYQPHPVRYD